MDRIGKPKSKASKAAVPCVPLLAKHLDEWRNESPYAGDADWVFPSFRNKGKTPRSGSILVTDYLKKAAYDAGVLKPGEKVQFGMHNLRHSLATYLIAVGLRRKDCPRHPASQQSSDHAAALRPRAKPGPFGCAGRHADRVFRAASEAADGYGPINITSISL